MGQTIRIHEQTGSGGGGITSVNGDTGPAVVLDADNISDTGTTNKFATQTELNQISTNNTNISSNTTEINQLKGSSTVASVATLTANINNDSFVQITAQAQNLTIAAPTGTPILGQKLIINITDNGTTRTISWNAVFNVVGVILPTATTPNKQLYIGVIYNSNTSNWDVVAVKEEV